LYATPTFYILNATSRANPDCVCHLKTDIYSLKPDIVVLTKTFLSGIIIPFHIDGYVAFRKDRLEHSGGGGCIFVRHCLLPTLLNEKNSRF